MTLRVTKGEILRQSLGLGADKMGTCKQLARAISEYKTLIDKRAAQPLVFNNSKLNAIKTRIGWLADSIEVGVALNASGGSMLALMRENKPDILV